MCGLIRERGLVNLRVRSGSNSTVYQDVKVDSLGEWERSRASNIFNRILSDVSRGLVVEVSVVEPAEAEPDWHRAHGW